MLLTTKVNPRLEGGNKRWNLLEDNVKIEWSNIGEGLFGEYNEDNPEDVNVLRFYTATQNEAGEWVDYEDGSFCTDFPATATDQEQLDALSLLMDSFYDIVVEGRSLKATAADKSWISLSWVQKE